MDTAAQVAEEVETSPVSAAGDADPVPAPSTSDAGDDLLLEELRIDDLSIDGMCGVY